MIAKKGLVVISILCLLLLSALITTAESIESPSKEENPLNDEAQDQNRELNGTGNITQEQEMTQNGTLEQEQLNYQNQVNNEDTFQQNHFQWRYQYRTEIQEGVKNDSVVMECNISKKAGNTYINSYEYQKGMCVEIKAQTKNRLEFKVLAEFKEGKVLVLNIEDSAFRIQNSQRLIIKFDGKEIDEADIDEVIKGNSTMAMYAKALGEDGGQFIVYIPHFSEHTITFEIIEIAASTSMNFIVVAIGTAILTIFILVVIVVKVKKYKNQ
jgi:competence protein ComGC